MFKRSLFSLLFILSIVLTACRAETPAAPTAEAAPTVETIAKSEPDFPVKIAVFGPFTGPAASIGQEQLNWARLAVEDFNAAAGWQVELVETDTELDAAKAVTAAEGVIADEDVYGAVGPAGSQEVEATAPMFKEARLVHVSPSATRPSLTQGGFDTFFRVVPTDAVQGPTDGNFIANTLKAKKVFLIDDQTSYSTGLADEVEKAVTSAGGEIVTRESVTQDDTDFSALVTRIKATGAEVVFFGGQIASQGALLGRQLKEQQARTILFGGDGFYSADDFITGAEGATEGAYVSAFAPDIHNLPSAADIVTRYTEKYGDFGTFGPPTYAATMVVLEAMQRAFEANGALAREAVRDEVAKTNQSLSVLGGPLAFDANGDVQDAQFYIFQVANDAFTLITDTTEAMLPPTPAVEKVTIAIMGPFTGPAASIGVEQLNFARLAVKHFEAATGIDVELLEEDTQLDAAIAVTVAERVIADGDVLAVVGPSGSQEVESSASLFEEAGLTRVSPSATRPSLTQQSWQTFFRTVPNDDIQGPTDANFIKDVLGATNVFIIDDQSSYSTSLSDIVQGLLTDAGVTVDRDSVAQEDTDFSALVTRINSTGATVVFFPGQIASQGALLAQQMVEQGVEATLVGGDGFASPDLINDATEGAYVSLFAPDVKTIPTAQFVVDDYTQEFGDFASSFGPPSYVATLVVLEAIQRAAEAGALTREGVLVEVAQTNMPITVLGGPFAFDENGDVAGAQFYMYQIKDGQFVTYVP